MLQKSKCHIGRALRCSRQRGALPRRASLHGKVQRNAGPELVRQDGTTLFQVSWNQSFSTSMRLVPPSTLKPSILQHSSIHGFSPAFFPVFLRLRAISAFFASRTLSYLIVPPFYGQSEQFKNEGAAMSAKYLFVTGGVVSSLGKGLAAASIGCLLENRGLRVNLMKFDPYLNVDPGHHVALPAWRGFRHRRWSRNRS